MDGCSPDGRLSIGSLPGARRHRRRKVACLSRLPVLRHALPRSAVGARERRGPRGPLPRVSTPDARRRGVLRADGCCDLGDSASGSSRSHPPPCLGASWHAPAEVARGSRIREDGGDPHHRSPRPPGPRPGRDLGFPVDGARSGRSDRGGRPSAQHGARPPARSIRAARRRDRPAFAWRSATPSSVAAVARGQPVSSGIPPTSTPVGCGPSRALAQPLDSRTRCAR